MANGFYIKSGFKIFDNKVFMLNPFRENEWELMPPDMNPFDDMDPIYSVGEIIKNLQEFEILDNDIEKEEYIVLGEIETSFVSPIFGIKALLGKSTKIELQIDSNLFQINQVRLLGPIGDQDNVDIVREVKFSNFNEPLVVNVP